MFQFQNSKPAVRATAFTLRFVILILVFICYLMLVFCYSPVIRKSTFAASHKERRFISCRAATPYIEPAPRRAAGCHIRL